MFKLEGICCQNHDLCTVAKRRKKKKSCLNPILVCTAHCTPSVDTVMFILSDLISESKWKEPAGTAFFQPWMLILWVTLVSPMYFKAVISDRNTCAKLTAKICCNVGLPGLVFNSYKLVCASCCECAKDDACAGGSHHKQFWLCLNSWLASMREFNSFSVTDKKNKRLGGKETS